MRYLSLHNGIHVDGEIGKDLKKEMAVHYFAKGSTTYT